MRHQMTSARTWTESLSRAEHAGSRTAVGLGVHPDIWGRATRSDGPQASRPALGERVAVNAPVDLAPIRRVRTAGLDPDQPRDVVRSVILAS